MPPMRPDPDPLMPYQNPMPGEAGVPSRHRHPQPVYGLVLEGRWRISSTGCELTRAGRPQRGW